MSERMTMARLETRVANLNRRMIERGSIVRYYAQGRSGHTCLDRIRASNGATMDLVRCGTKGEIGEFLDAMMIALDDARRKT